MEGLPVLGSQGWEAKCEAGSADQRPEPVKAGPPVTMRLEFKLFVAQLEGCIRAKSASSLLSLVMEETRERVREGPSAAWLEEPSLDQSAERPFANQGETLQEGCDKGG